MMMKMGCLMIVASIIGTTHGATTISPTDKNIQYIGRFASGNQGMMFDMPGCEIRVRLTTQETSVVTVALAQKHQPPPANPQGNSKNSGFQANAFVVWIDGVRQGIGGYNATFTTGDLQDEDVHQYNITNAIPLSAGTHTVRILKATEADWNGGDPVPNYMTFAGFVVDQGTATTTPSTSLPSRKIEFLGDSITAGFCNECENSHIPSAHGEAYGATWDHQICERLYAQCHTAAWSGLGMVKNCCGGNTTMPTIFNQTLATELGSVWNFSSWKADALVINLGTNDGGASISPQYTYVATYTELVMEASRHYGPDLHVFLSCGPMSEIYCPPVMQVLANVTRMGVKAYFLDQRGFLSGKYGPSCCGHPSIEVDTAMAINGTAFIKEKLGW